MVEEAGQVLEAHILASLVPTGMKRVSSKYFYSLRRHKN